MIFEPQQTMPFVSINFNTNCVTHKWQFLRASGPKSNQDIVRIMKFLQPLLQDSIHKKCNTRLWDAPYTVKGPLTWRQFHRLAGRGTDDRCEPQPIPSLIVGHDKDWLSLSPYALQHWDKLLLEPYSYSRDVAYIVVAPDDDAILPRVKSFFRELSTVYEVSKLGRHCAISKVLRDGILRVGKNAKNKLANEPLDEWFAILGDSETADMLKLYSQVCRHHLAPLLLHVPMDHTLLDRPDNNSYQQQQQPQQPQQQSAHMNSSYGGVYYSQSSDNRTQSVGSCTSFSNMPPPNSSSGESNPVQSVDGRAPTPKSESGKQFLSNQIIFFLNKFH